MHDLAFDRFPDRVPADAGGCSTAPGVRAAVKRADAILAPSSATADDLRGDRRRRPDEGARHAAGRRRSPSGAADPAPRLERDWASPRPTSCSWARSSRGRTSCTSCAPTGRSAPDVAARARAGRPRRLAHRGPRATSSRGDGPGTVVRTGRVCRRRPRRPLPRRADAFAYPSALRGLRPAGARGDGARRAHRDVGRSRARARSPATPPCWWNRTTWPGSPTRSRACSPTRRSPTDLRCRGLARAAAVHVGGHRARYARGLPPGRRSDARMKVTLISTVLNCADRVAPFLASLAAQTRAPGRGRDRRRRLHRRHRRARFRADDARHGDRGAGREHLARVATSRSRTPRTR